MKKLLIIIAVLTANLCSAQSEELKSILSRGQSLIYMPDHNEVRVGGKIKISNTGENVIFGQEGSRTYPYSDPESFLSNDPPVPGLNVIQGTLTQVSPQGDGWYWVTCVPSSSNCLIYFLPY